MREMSKIIVQVVHVIAFWLLMLYGVLGAIYEIIGAGKFEEILAVIGISNGFERFRIIGAILCLLLITTYFIKVKLFSGKDDSV